MVEVNLLKVNIDGRNCGGVLLHSPIFLGGGNYNGKYFTKKKVE